MSIELLTSLLWRVDKAVWLASLAGLAAIWLGYPLAVAAWARWRPYAGRRTPPEAPAAAWPRLSVIVSAHNEAAHIEARIRNLWAQRYPPARVEILVSEDGSDDGTAARVAALAAGGGPMRLRLLSAPQRLGKAAAINRAAQAAAGEILVFTDANNEYAPEALRRLAAPFADASVGAVTGRKAVAASTGVGGGESVYWRYEGWLTACEAATGTTVAAYGEALAVRRECFVPLPTAAMVNDDLYLGLQVLAQGRRVLAAPEARSCEHGAADDAAEWERRRRMAVGHWAALAEVDWRQLPAVNLCKVLFHEILRPLSGLALATALLAGLALLAAPAAALGGAARALALAQAAALGAVAAVGLARRCGLRLGRAEAPYFFCLALAAALAGGWRYGRQGQTPLWRRVERAAPAANRRGAAPAAVTTARILHGLFWASSSFLLGKLLVFGSVVVLARLLAPRAFGEVALAVSFITVLEILGTLGLTSALIFEEQSVAAAADFCFWVTLAASLIETGLGWSLAPRLAAFFHEPALAPMLRVLSLCLVITALGNTHDTLLRRQLAFRAKLLPDLGQAAAKGLASISLALAGFGAWSLIWGQLLGSSAATALLWWISPWRPAWRWDAGVVRRMRAYAKHIYLLDGSSVLLTNLDALTIGRMLSDVWLGFYTLAFRIPEVLLLSVLNVITRVVFPAFSRLQGDRAQLRATLLDTARYTALLTLPMAAGMGVLAPAIVYGIYGWHWGPSIPVLQVLALYAGIRCITHHFGDAYKAMGRPDILTRTTLAWWLLLPPSLILGARWGGIVGVAWGQVTTRVAMSVLHVYLVNRFLQLRPADLWRCFAPALEGTAAMVGGLLLLRPWVAGWAPRPELAAMTLAGMAIYAALLWLRHPQVLLAVATRRRGLGGGPREDAAPREDRAPAAPAPLAAPAMAVAPALPAALAAAPLYAPASTAAEPRA
ncbi:MAG TPA: oligosaccharide flippase family protein [Terriglobales bacterium]|nr:oligosaccharide flippase family protein [Terriglobales bacterium]